MNEIFISYFRKDLELALFLKSQLEVYGFSLWQDLEDLPVGEPWRQQVQVAIQKSQNVICLLSDDFVVSANCQWEVQQAIAHNKRLFPVAKLGFSPDGVTSKLKPCARKLFTLLTSSKMKAY
ncbi:MAG: toll/interleukin-1 receptor domain-containing protein [Symploca sp. SIO3C6]|nr:toll/interleukin-1 receptor domain-containing protein [Symploca sp. SIO3C6]